MTDIIGQIPARMGSERVKQKNLRLLGGKPLLSHSIHAARQSKKLTRVYVNSESVELGEVALREGVLFYKRSPSLATSQATQDQFNYDFIQGTKADILVLVNPVCPFIEGVDIDNIIQFFLDNNFDTVVTTRSEQLHAFYDGVPINFSLNADLPRTQDMTPVQICSWALCVWDAKKFLMSYDTKGYASFVGKIGFYPLPYLKSIKISTEEDFSLAESIFLLNKLRSCK